jgi:hypothetical protein
LAKLSTPSARTARSFDWLRMTANPTAPPTTSTAAAVQAMMRSCRRRAAARRSAAEGRWRRPGD